MAKICIPWFTLKDTSPRRHRAEEEKPVDVSNEPVGHGKLDTAKSFTDINHEETITYSQYASSFPS